MNLKIFHGTNHIIEKPEYHLGKPNNDYGYGFYCTESFDLACEWASKSSDMRAIVNEYEIDETNLNVLDLCDPKFNILNWLTILINNRTFSITSEIGKEAKEYLINNFSIDVSKYDVIKGYRADDSYFSFAEDFLNNIISIDKLSKAMKLGKLGIQYVVISKKAFDHIKFIDSHEVDYSKFHIAYVSRDSKARNDYYKNKSNESLSNQMFVMDIIRGGLKNGDPRI